MLRGGDGSGSTSVRCAVGRAGRIASASAATRAVVSAATSDAARCCGDGQAERGRLRGRMARASASRSARRIGRARAPAGVRAGAPAGSAALARRAGHAGAEHDPEESPKRRNVETARRGQVASGGRRSGLYSRELSNRRNGRSRLTFGQRNRPRRASRRRRILALARARHRGHSSMPRIGTERADARNRPAGVTQFDPVSTQLADLTGSGVIPCVISYFSSFDPVDPV